MIGLLPNLYRMIKCFAVLPHISLVRFRGERTGLGSLSGASSSTQASGSELRPAAPRGGPAAPRQPHTCQTITNARQTGRLGGPPAGGAGYSWRRYMNKYKHAYCPLSLLITVSVVGKPRIAQ